MSEVGTTLFPASIRLETMYTKFVCPYTHVHHVPHVEHVGSLTRQNDKARFRKHCTVFYLSHSRISVRSKLSPVSVILLSSIYLLSSKQSSISLDLFSSLPPSFILPVHDLHHDGVMSGTSQKGT